MFGLQRESKRYSHDHLTPQDANAEQTRRRRHKVFLDGKERRYHSQERGYRSDNETRRRHRHDGDRDRYRASSSHRPKDDDCRRQHSSSGTERERSHAHVYGEHRFDDFFDKRDIHPKPLPTTSGLPPSPSAHSASNQIRGPYNQVREWKSVEPLVQHSKAAMYGDHHIFVAQPKASARRDKISVQREYGEHHLDDEPLPKAPPYEFFAGDVRHTMTPSSLPPPAKKQLPESTSKHDDGTTRTGSRDDITKLVTLPPTNTQRVHRISLPPSVRDSAYTLGDRSSQNVSDNRPSTSGTDEAFNTNAKLPRIHVSPYSTGYSQSLPDIVSPDGSRSEPDNDMQRSRSGSGTSTTSTRIPSPSPSSSTSTLLGPRTYHYQPLQASEIRLVRVLPERMWKLKCEILHVSLDHAPEYSAISVSSYRSLKTHAYIELV
jgi:hypothetical protein